MLYAYTRKQALADGVQSDVSEVAREAGLTFPVYLTRAVSENYVRVPDGVRCLDESGRLWDVVWMLRGAARRTSGPPRCSSASTFGTTTATARRRW